MDYLRFFYVAVMFASLLIVLKETYEIYWTEKKAALKEKPIVKYGLRLLFLLLILPCLSKYLLS